MKSIFFYFFLIFLFCLLSCTNQNKSQTRFALGTVCTINLFEQSDDDYYNQIFDKLTEIEKKMTIRGDFIEESEISAINTNAGIKPVLVSDEVFTVVKMAKIIAEKSNGAFDPTIGPLVKLWNITDELPKVPEVDAIKKAKQLVDWKKLILDEENKTIYLSEPGMVLDVGGIAKGYATDVIVDMLKNWNIKRAMIDLGGNIYAFGKRSDDSLWRIGIKNPVETEGQPALRVDVSDLSVVTSGSYERFFETEGKKYHHILDSTTGYPTENDLLSVTIVCESAIIADALSTTVFVLGSEQGLKFLQDTNNFFAEGILITNKRKILTTNQIKKKITVLNNSFELK